METKSEPFVGFTNNSINYWNETGSQKSIRPVVENHSFLRLSTLGLTYFVLTLCFFICANAFLPNKEIMFFQLSLVASIMGIGTFLMCRYWRFHVFVPFLFLFQVVWIVLFRTFNILHYGNGLGYHPADALFYHGFGSRFAVSAQSLAELSTFLKSYSYGVDDWGFCIVASVVYYMFGSDAGFFILALLNAVFVVWGACLIYRIAKRFSSEMNARAVCLLWAVMPFSLYTSSVGLKENYMVFLVIAAVYCVYRYQERSSLKFLLIGIGSILALLLFRTALTFMLALSFLFVFLLKSRSFTRHVNLWLLVGGFFSFIMFTVAVDFIGSIRGNVTAESLGNQADNIEGHAGIVVTITNLLAILIGPFPSFISDPVKVNYITLYSFGAMVKMWLSFYYVYGVVRILQKREVYFYSMLVFIVFHSLMLVVSFYSLHDRYQWPQIPFVLLISIYGFQEMANERRRSIRYLSSVYPFLMFVVVLVYNIRVC